MGIEFLLDMINNTFLLTFQGVTIAHIIEFLEAEMPVDEVMVSGS